MAFAGGGLGAPSPVRQVKLDKECELRIEVAETPFRLRVVNGTAEIFGTEIPPEIWLSFSPRLKFAVFTWYGATIEMDGATETDYTADETPMVSYVNVHAVLEGRRNQAKSSPPDSDASQGPRVIVVGPTDSGNSTLSKMLLSWAAKQGWKPTYVDLDVGQGSITIPGCIAATPIEMPIDPVEGIPLEMPLVYFHGHTTPTGNVDLYKVLVTELSRSLEKQFSGNAESRAAGMVINTMGWIDGPGYELLLHAIHAFNASVVLVLGQNDRGTRNNELMLDGNPRLNLASFVTTWMEPECDKLMMAAANKNYVDMDEYPVTTELQNRCVNMIAHLFNAPVGEDEAAIGVGTVGSSEAIMLAGLAFKRKWQTKRKALGLPTDNPNIVTGANVQVCWEKFARYFEVELKEVKLREGYYIMDPAEAVEMVDENTICVAAILGSTLTGEFEDVKLLNQLLTEKNKETGWDTSIHVDAASGGFIAPFLYPDLEWDFRLPLVKSINVSGHKYGLVYAGIGWVIWRSPEDLPDELVFHINYLGSDQPTFTLNFSKGSSQIIGQYYQFIRLGFDGYKCIMENCLENAKVLQQGLEKTGKFDIVSKDIGVPLVAFSLKDSSSYTVFKIADTLRRFGWILPAYTMPANAEHIAVLRAVIREDFSNSLAQRLVSDIDKVIQELEGLPTPGILKANRGEEGKDESVREIATYWRKITKKNTSGVC